MSTDRFQYVDLLLNNELIKTILSIRVDTLCKMINMYSNGYIPAPEEEGATGSLDNKGALFVPGGLVMEDSDKNLVLAPKKAKSLSKASFVSQIQNAMQYDNATLLYRNKIYFGVNLQNGFFIEKASKLLTIKRSYSSKKMPLKVGSEEITRYFSPSFITPPYGSRIKLSSCLAVCLCEFELYFVECVDFLKLRINEHKLIWSDLIKSLKPVKKKDGTILYMPHIVVCHTTRYLEDNFVGITRILGFGGFGDFALVTFEKMNKKLKIDMRKSGNSLKDLPFISYNGINVYCVLRVYFYGGKSFKTFVIDLRNDLGINYNSILKKAKAKYENKNQVVATN